HWADAGRGARAAQTRCPGTRPEGNLDGDALRMTRGLSLALLLGMCACTSPESSGIQVIVGARLEPGPSQPAIEHSVIVISDGKIQAIGPQASVPVPKGAEVVRGTGKLV